MKKTITLLFVMAFSAVSFAQKGNLQVGVNGGLPIGENLSEVTSFALNVEANYLFDLSEKVQVGPSVSFVSFFVKDFPGMDVENPNFLPIAAAVRYAAFDAFSVGADLGYALGLNEENDGGFNLRALVGYDVNEKFTVQASYSNISNSDWQEPFSNIGLGVVYNF